MNSLISQKNNRLEIVPMSLNTGPLAKVTAIGSLAAIILLGFYMIKQIIGLNFNALGPNQFMNFLKGSNFLSIAVGMILAYNARDLVKSITENFVVPLLEPVMPFLKADFEVQVGPFNFKLGKLISDILSFLISVYVVYVMLVSINQQGLQITSPGFAI